MSLVARDLYELLVR